ncbi:MAG: AEC family transporter [Planctomycetes bacterium]|nr:AEC family transporter [Planctomycetota bacterium]
MVVLHTLAPLVLIVALGLVLRRSGFMPAEFYRGMNRLVYWVGLPALLFDKTSRAQGVGDQAMVVFLVMLAATLGCVALACAAGPLLGVRRRSLGAFVQGAYRGNLAYVGLPVVLFAFGEADTTWNAVAALALAPMVPIYNAMAVVALTAGQDPQGGSRAGQAGRTALRVITNPLLLACVAGIAVSLTGLDLPLAASRTFQAVGQMALPLSLLGIGASLSFHHLRAGWRPVAAASALKLVAAPLLGAAAAWALGACPEATRIALLMLACPTAVVSYVMAEQLGADDRLAGGIVLLTTIASVGSLAAVLLLV